MNILVVTAHHDDLELGCGGTIAKFVDEGHQVVSLVMTHSAYEGYHGMVLRTKEAAIAEARLASKVLGYELISFDEDTFDIPINDSNIVRILDVIHKYSIDTVFTHWHSDTHPPHRKINSMVLHACRHVPRVLGIAVNWHIGEQSFSPRLFVPIDGSQWERKIKALQCYESEFQRAGASWVEYLDNQTKNYGLQCGVERAEGYVVYKYLWSV